MRHRLLILFGNRRNLARFVLVAAASTVALQVASYLPQETGIEIALGPDHRSVAEVRLSYLQHGEELRGVRLRFPEGAPAVIRHRVDLSPGRYRLSIELRSRDGATRIAERDLRAPAAGSLRFSAP